MSEDTEREGRIGEARWPRMGAVLASARLIRLLIQTTGRSEANDPPNLSSADGRNYQPRIWSLVLWSLVGRSHLA